MSFVKSINKENLKIARENIGISSQSASKKISGSIKDIVADWENGKSLPTWSQVTKLSKLYNVSEFLFFSEELVKKQKLIPDYRVGFDMKSEEKVKKLINLVLTRQKWLEQYAKEDGFVKNSLQGSGKDLTSPRQLANYISNSLEIDICRFKEISGRKNALNYLIEKAESKGIFVGKTLAQHRIKTNDMRGLFISNDYCPFIILNRKDSVSAQIFSFIHELAHFFRKSDAVSNSLDFRGVDRGISSEEIFCNKVAAELLLPEEEFNERFYEKSDINSFSKLYKVSSIFIFYRLKELGKIKDQLSESLEKEIQKEIELNLLKKAEKDKLRKGGSYINNMRDSNGSLFNRIVYKNYSEKRVGYVEASKLLLFSPEKI
ncbi:MAG: ImmA/IrrE family metallo-endopeptidase [Minisyncoccus archaeiphilus]|uniref:ImmA/IrrE family metallo-endopeptidase n=1 Tax=Minisyncoccus archaeiphilus TaxID=3238481 RepID=UPI002B10DD1F|nr:MAG: ImmA/IrrE family metallo-endopeptidase [Candidatus Parcubacteria bacterium]